MHGGFPWRSSSPFSPARRSAASALAAALLPRRLPAAGGRQGRRHPRIRPAVRRRGRDRGRHRDHPAGRLLPARREARHAPGPDARHRRRVRFRLPETLGDRARLVLFQGENVRDFSWTRRARSSAARFDPAAAANTREPNANTRRLPPHDDPGRGDGAVLFRDVKSEGLPGPSSRVFGAEQARLRAARCGRSPREVTVENCTLLDSGKFMWDYGYLWQITVWPEDHDRPREARWRRSTSVPTWSAAAR